MSSTAVRPSQRALPRISSPVARRVASRVTQPNDHRLQRRRMFRDHGPAAPSRRGRRVSSLGIMRRPVSPLPVRQMPTDDSGRPAPSGPCVTSGAGALRSAASAVGDTAEDPDDDGEPPRHRGPYYAFALLSAKRRGADVEAVVA